MVWLEWVVWWEITLIEAGMNGGRWGFAEWKPGRGITLEMLINRITIKKIKKEHLEKPSEQKR